MLDSEHRAYMLAQLERHEGLRLAAYLDTLGILTIGIGHNCRAHPVHGVAKVGDKITPEQARKLFEKDVAKFEEGLRLALPWTWELVKTSPPRYAVLVNMAFNMGLRGLLEFKNTLSFVEAKQFRLAASHMLQSKWARQVGARAKELAKQMEEGQWS